MTVADNAFILELTNTKEWLQFIGDRNLKTPDDATLYIQKILGNPDFNYRLVRLKDSRTPIGAITLIKRTYLEYSDFGFAFLPAYFGQGFAAEAASAVLASVSVSNPVILAITVRENARSISLLERLGFKFDCETENEGELLLTFRLNT